MNDPKKVVPLTAQKPDTEEKQPPKENPTADAFRFMHEDLKRSGLTPEDMGCHITAVLYGAPEHLKHVICSYRIPFYDLDGNAIPSMWRDRRKLKPGAENIKDLGKYTQPSIHGAQGYGRLPYMPKVIWGMAGKVQTAHICEGEKKTASVIKHGGVAALGIPGKDVSKETVEILAQAIRKLGATRVCLWPDADIQRLDVARSYGRLRSRLLEALRDLPGIEVFVIQPSWDVRKFKGIDDALVGGWTFAEGKPLGEELPIDIRGLADAIGLDYTTGARGDSFALTINDDNVCRVLEHRPLWGDLWMNRDSGRWMVGETYLDPEVEVTTFTRRLQRVFGMRKVTSTLVGNSIDHVCRLSKRSPWADYLSDLKWDGEKRLETWLQRACGVEDSIFAREAGIKWLVSASARSLNPGCAVDWMLILSGPQGCGKSSLPRALVPEPFKKIVSMSPHTQDKELSMAAGECRILCFDEMASFFDRKDDTEFIKQFVTATEDVFRPPYGRANVREPRGCVLYGSTNRKDCIKGDSSGYRRWVVLEAKGVVETEFGDQFDWKWLEANREQLWAEAVALYRDGLNYSQVRGASEQAKSYVRENRIEGALLSALYTLHTEKEGHPLTVGKLVTYDQCWILMEKDRIQRTDQNQRLVDQFYEGYGCEKHRTGRGRGFRISERLLKVLDAPE